MHSIVVHSRKKNLFGRLVHRKYSRDLPGSWEEVPVDRIPAVISLLSKYEWDIVQTRILQELLQLPTGIFLSLTDYEVVEIVQKIKWIQELPSEKALLPSFQHRGTTYFLPKEGFSNGNAFEYPVMDEYLNEFIQGGNESTLYKIAGLLLRPQKDGEHRVPTSSRSEVETAAAYFKDLPKYALSVCLRYAIGVTHYVHKIYGDWLFHPSEEGEEDTTQKGVDFGWWGVYMDIAESGVFGKYPEVLTTSFHEICVYLVKKKQEAMEMRDKYSNSKTKTL